MKKSLFIIAAAAMMTACTSEVLREDYQKNDVNEAIDFATFVQKAVNTRATSENNGMTTTTGLENFHESFMVWGYKYNSAKTASEDAVFEGKKVSYSSVASADAKDWDYTSWTYSPIAYWDKSADYYNFYAAAPFNDKWNFENYQWSFEDFTLTGATLAPSASADAKASFKGTGDIDLMISNDIKNYSTYKTRTPVEFNFNHILSRLNISVELDEDHFASSDVCTLEKLFVFNMVTKGSFDESKAVATASGECKRWETSTNSDDVLAAGSGYSNASGDALSETPKYYYRALCIPQEVKYAASGDCPLNGKGLDGESEPYINIQYTINEDSYSYYYNLADILNGKKSNAHFEFREGWMNTLHIIISPAIINFDAETFDWNDEKEYQYTIPK